MTEKEKMQAGEWFSPNDEELVRDRARARHLTHRLNVALKDKDATYLATLRELCPRVEAMIRAPFHCDYGYNISIGKGSYVNFNCVFLDLGPIRLGQRCLIGPGVQLLTAVHPMNAAERATGKEKGAGVEALGGKVGEALLLEHKEVAVPVVFQHHPLAAGGPLAQLFLQHGPVCVQSVPGRPGKISLHIAVGHEGVIRLGPGVTGAGIFRALEAVFHAAVLPRAPLHRAGGTARAAAARAVLRLADVVHRAQPAVQAAQGKAGLGPRLFLHTKPPSIVEARRARITACRPVPAGRAARSEMPIPACCRGIPA